MQLRHLGDKHGQERGCVEDKVCQIILGVETCQEVPAGAKGASLTANTYLKNKPTKHSQKRCFSNQSYFTY